MKYFSNTPTPNILFDVYLKLLKPAELKVDRTRGPGPRRLWWW